MGLRRSTQWRFSSAFEDTSLFQNPGLGLPRMPHHNTLVLMRVPCAVPMCSRNPFLRQRHVQRVRSSASQWASPPTCAAPTTRRRSPAPTRPPRAPQGTERAFPSSSVEAFKKRTIQDWPIDYDGDGTQLVRHFYVAVDPSGGGASRFAVASLTQFANGTIAVRRLEVAQRFPRPQVV